MAKIEVAVILAGGYGTRFLPTTKSIPKEMFPLGSKPVILHVIEEVVAAGIKEIIIVSNREKKSLENFFKPASFENDCLQASVKIDQAQALDRIVNLADIKFVYTGKVCGNAASLTAARDLLNGRSFALLWSDEIIISKTKPRLAQCLDTYEKYQLPVISAVRITDPRKRSFYGMARLESLKGEKNIKKIVEIVEEPAPGQEPSEYAAHGAYILPGNLFDLFKYLKIKPGADINMPAIINAMLKNNNFLAKIIQDGVYLDCGNPLAYVCSQIEYGLKFSGYRKEIKEFLKKHHK